MSRARVLLLALALSALQPGLWALLLPASFHGRFPGLGLRWVAPLGPYDEHLVRDVGAAFLALAALSLLAARSLQPALVRAAGVVWLVFQLPHLATHLHLAPGEALQVAVLLGQVVLAAALLVPDRAGPPRRG